MEAPFETEFLIRRIGQLWTQAADLPERSAAQAQIEDSLASCPTTCRGFPETTEGRRRVADANRCWWTRGRSWPD